MADITTQDKTTLRVKDWSSGRPVIPICSPFCATEPIGVPGCHPDTARRRC